jgi:hypothetical protein
MTAPLPAPDSEGTKYEQVVARRLSRADKVRGRELWTAEFLIGLALYFLIAEMVLALLFMWRIVSWMNGQG